MQKALEHASKCSADEIMHILQGFRNRQNKGLYQVIRKSLVDRKKTLNLENGQLIDLFYMFASSRPKQFGVYRVYAAQELEELIAHYEHDLCDAAEKANPEQLTRIA
jgi:hypothetical protein